MSTANDVLRREAEWRAHLETCDCQIYHGELRELTTEAQVYYMVQAASAAQLAEEIDRLHHALDEAKAVDLHRNLNRRIAGALGLLDERGDDETGEAYLPSWHDMPDQVTALRAEVERLTAALAESEAAHARRTRSAADFGVAVGARIDDVEASRDAARAEIVELRLTLAAEQGRAEGAPSPHWTYSAGTWSRDRYLVERNDNGFWSLLGLFGYEYCTLNHGIPARVAMSFGDRIDQIARLSHTGTESDPEESP